MNTLDSHEEGFYVYAIARDPEGKIPPLSGLQGMPVRSLAHAGLIAVVQACEPKTLEIQDKELITQWVLTHQAVIDGVWEHCETLVPFGFGKVIKPSDGRSALDTLTAWMAAESIRLNAILDRLHNKAEYGLQVVWDTALVLQDLGNTDAEISHLRDDIARKPAGVAYLLNHKIEQLMKQRLEGLADDTFKQLYHQVRDCVLDIKVEKVRKMDPPKQMILHLSCLQERGDTARLGTLLERLGAMCGFEVAFTGPWPPYSFAAV